MDTGLISRIAADLLATFGTAQTLPHVTAQYPGFTLDDAYAVAHQMRRLREARGERVIGRKVGGTNPRPTT